MGKQGFDSSGQRCPWKGVNMSLTKFPNGISSFGVPVLGGGGLIPTTTGSYYFVDSATGSSSNEGLTPDRPMATINQAVDKATANVGDVIIVMPNHAENLAAAGALTLDVAGLTVVGLGAGAQRPNLTHTADAADINITGADTVLRNITITSNTADVTASLDIDATNVWLDGVEWIEGSALCFVDVIVTGGDNTCDGLKITGCKCVGADAANDGFLNATGGDIDQLVLVGNHLVLSVATTEPVIEVTGKSLTNAVVTHNYISRMNESGITFVDSDQSDNSGIFAYNLIASDDDDSATPFDVTGASCFENYQMGEAGADASGLLLPAVDNDA